MKSFFKLHHSPPHFLFHFTILPFAIPYVGKRGLIPLIHWGLIPDPPTPAPQLCETADIFKCLPHPPEDSVSPTVFFKKQLPADVSGFCWTQGPFGGKGSRASFISRRGTKTNLWMQDLLIRPSQYLEQRLYLMPLKWYLDKIWLDPHKAAGQ